MSAVWMWLRAVMRQRWRATLALALLVGVAGGASIGAAAGARRTQTAFARMREATHAGDLLVSTAGTGFTGFFDALGRLDGVAEMSTLAGVPVAVAGADGKPAANSPLPIAAVSSWRVQRPKIVAGRMFDETAADEVILDPIAARELHAVAGTTLRMAVYASCDDFSSPTKADTVTMRVAGVGVPAERVVPTTFLDAQPIMIFTPAFFRSRSSFARPGALCYDGAQIRLDPGIRARDIERALIPLLKTYPDTFGQSFNQESAQVAEREQRAMAPLAVALYAFAGLMGVATVFVLGQAIARQLAIEADEHPALRALGMDRRQLIGISLLRVMTIAVAGAVVATGVALAVSPFMPIGAARVAEPRPGFEANIAVVTLGALAVVILLVARSLIAAIKASSSDRDGTDGRSVVTAAAAQAGLNAPATTGISMAFQQRAGARTLPLRSALVGTVIGLAALTAALTFAATLDSLVTEPDRSGWTWDLLVDASFGVVPWHAHGSEVAADPDVVGVAAGTYGTVQVGGRDVSAVGLDMLKGKAYPRLLQGRAALARDEIVLGTVVMRRIGADVGDRVDVVLTGEKRTMTVVGRAVFPALGRGSFAPTSLGEGAALVASQLSQNLPPERFRNGERYNFILLDVRDGIDVRALESRLRRVFLDTECQQTDDCFVAHARDRRPIELSVLARVRAVPLILAGLLALFAAASLGHALVTSVRLRARDLAVLKTIGFVTGQVRAAVAWQTSSLSFVALLLGLPLGVLFGRVLWSAFADQLGVPPSTVLSMNVLGFAALVTIVLANLIGAVPARAAARTEPAVALRYE